VSSGKKLWTANQPLWNYVTGMDLHASGRFLVTGSWSGALDVWNGQTGEHIRSIRLEDVKALDLNDATNRIAVATEAQRLCLVPLDNTEPILLRSFNRKITWDLAFSDDGNLLATAAGDRVEVWDFRLRNVVQTLITRHRTSSNTLANMVWQVRFRAGGSKLVSATDRVVQLWDVASGRELATTRSGGIPESLAVSEDGKKVSWITTSNDEVHLWLVEQGKQKSRKITGIHYAAFSPSLDRLVYTTGRRLGTMELPTWKTLSIISCESPTSKP
jgi:WD40 repeat protein